MTIEEMNGYLASLSNDELMQSVDIAVSDLRAACKAESNGDWHNACFAALVAFSGELSHRGLRRVDARI